MGCKCTNSNEEENEIQKNALEEENAENAENDFNKNFDQNDDLLGLNNQENLFQEQIENNEPATRKDSNNEKLLLLEKENNINDYDPNAKYADYPEKIVELINNIREDPVGYADIIEDNIKNIIEEEDKNEPTNIRLIFKKKVKVALNKGEPVFREAAEILRSLSPLPPLEFREEKCIPLPENEEELKDPTFLREKVKKIRKETRIDVFF